MRFTGHFSALLLMSSACLVLVGCASTSPTPSTFGLAATTAPAPITGYDWFYHVDADQASLAYGLKDSDDLRLGLECSRSAGRLELSAVAPTGIREIYLESGGDTERFPAHGEPAGLHDGDFLTAEAKADVPVFQRFRRVGWLAQWQGDRRETYAAHPTSLPDIERFFAFCG